jgi:phosphoribosylformylglycinamidine synthase
VAGKTFLISIGDRTVGGMTARDQMVGPWQVPVADVAVTLLGYSTYLGEAFAVGERTPIAVISGPASGRMAIGEAITNIAAARIEKIGDIKLSANWMAAAGHHGEDATLFDTVRAVGMELCPQLGISIPVGKDSMSMKTSWTEPVNPSLPPGRGKDRMGVETRSTSQTSTPTPATPARGTPAGTPPLRSDPSAVPLQEGGSSTVVQGGGNEAVVRKEVTAPLSLIVSAFAPTPDAHATLTPQLAADLDTVVLLFDIGAGKNRMGGSALAQVYNQVGNIAPDVDDAQKLKAFFELIQRFNVQGKLLAYHDRSDGGMFAALCEMAFASHIGLDINLNELKGDATSALFNEELGALVQVRRSDLVEIFVQCDEAGLAAVHEVAELNTRGTIEIRRAGKTLFSENAIVLQRIWSETTYRMQKLRDNPVCAQQEYDRILDARDPGLHVKLTYDPDEPFLPPGRGKVRMGVEVSSAAVQQASTPTPTTPARGTPAGTPPLRSDPSAVPLQGGGGVLSARPRIAILREQGVNGHVEMAAAFDRADFTAVDVHMSDVIAGRMKLADFKGIAACGGFSYGDVLGAGEGWANSILFNPRARDEFEAFFKRDDTFALGVCNGCQMMSNLHEIIPGAEHWAHFARNQSEQFEARFVMVEVQQSPSVLFDGMAGSRMPIVVAHGEGYADFDSAKKLQAAQPLVTLRYVDNYGKPTEIYPLNPNGSPQGITGLTTPDGRFSIMMPHPERVFRAVQNSWYPHTWKEEGAWLRMFQNARKWVG